MTEAQVRGRRKEDARKAQRRKNEKACALDFLRNGNADGRHDEICIHRTPCSRDYNVRPYAEAVPDSRMYEGTGIGLLYGLGGPASFWIDLAGWNLVGRREVEGM